MPKSHDLVLVRPRGNLKAVWERLFFDDKRMVARRFKRIVQPLEKLGAVVVYHRGFTVHQPIRPDDITAEYITDALMSETDA